MLRVRYTHTHTHTSSLSLGACVRQHDDDVVQGADVYFLVAEIVQGHGKGSAERRVVKDICFSTTTSSSSRVTCIKPVMICDSRQHH